MAAKYKKIHYEKIFTDTTGNFVRPQEPHAYDNIIIYVRTDTNNDAVALFLIDDNGEHKMEKSDSDYEFDYFSYEVKLGEKQYRYCIKIVCEDEICYYNALGITDKDEEYYRFTITPDFEVPEWAKGAVMYQIFVDRFYNGDTSNDVLNNEYFYLGTYSRRVDNWNTLPLSVDVNEFYGGDLQGVIDKLDYLYKLGIEVIYLNPIFVSPSSHKYDTQDYDHVDPHFGKLIYDEGNLLTTGDENNKNATKYINRITNKDNQTASDKLLEALITKAHDKGMRVILDGVFNHCGSFNKWFDKERIYEDNEAFEKGAYIDRDSPYNSFFKFTSQSWPLNNDYEGWWGHNTLPKLNYEDSEKLCEYIIKIARKWVSPPYNADGWRLDVAADLGRTKEFNLRFWKRFRNEVKEANPEAIIIAEHYGNPHDWLDGNSWDTIMNYDAFMEPVSWLLTGMEKHSDAVNDSLLGDTERFANTMKYMMANMQKQSILTAMNELSNHDHSRFLTRTNHIVGRMNTVGQETANKDTNIYVFKLAIVMQMTWPGSPTVYYGDEAGLCGFTDPDNRRTYPWGNENVELIDFHRDIINIHKNSKALRKGSLKILYSKNNVLVYARFYEDEYIITLINTSNEDRRVEIPVWKLGINEASDLTRIYKMNIDEYNIGKQVMNTVNGHVIIEAKPYEAVIINAYL